MTIGNPAPLGLLCFGMTTLLLMYIDMGWVEHDFEIQIYGTAVFLGGVGQIIVAIFEIIKGSSFSFAVFGCYGAFWLGWAAVLLERSRNTSDFGEAVYPKGSTAFFAQWGVLSSCFWIIARRKNICLNIVFALLSSTFYLLSITVATGSEGVKKAAGAVGFCTAVGAFYTGVAELVNEEYGKEILPGLAARIAPHREEITPQSISARLSYDKRSNTVFLAFRGLHVRSLEAVQAIHDGVEASIQGFDAPDEKVHAVVDYKDVIIAEPVVKEYWQMVADIEKRFYLSAKRFAVSSFGTLEHEPIGVPASGLAPMGPTDRKKNNQLTAIEMVEPANASGSGRATTHEAKESIDETTRLTSS